MKARFFFLFFFAACLIHTSAFGYEISSVKVTGEKDAQVFIQATPAPEGVPTMQVSGGEVDLTFAGAELESALNGEIEVASPHAMIASISLVAAGNHVVKGKIAFNGKTENLKNRLSFSRDARGLTLKVEYPKGVNATLDLLQEEQKPLSVETHPVRVAETGFNGRQLLLVIILLALAGGCTAFFFRFLKMKGKWQGSRKYLIEQLGYCPLGAKAGVSLIKVGREFLLVGVTSNQVSILSTLPKLEAQYSEDSSLERDTFREGLREEVGRMQKEISL